MSITDALERQRAHAETQYVDFYAEALKASVRFDCQDKFEWSWDEEPKRFEWSQGDFVYIPPYCTHKHFNADSKNEARIIVINSRILKPMGFDWFEQLENAEGY